MGTSSSTDIRRFHIHDRIGSGGFGDVYRATMQSIGGVESEVAIKVLHQKLAATSQPLARLRDEGKMLGVLRHPSIVRVIDLVELDGRAALVTEYIEGSDLGVIFRHGGLGPRALCEVIAHVASALNAAYSTQTASGTPLNLVHRDVKPENVRVGRHGEVKLLDFGIAKAGGMRREAQTRVGDVMGSYRYMAPERLARTHEDRPEGDVYSLGALLYEGLAGKRLFSGADLRAQVALAGNDGAHDEFARRRVEALNPSPAVRAVLLAVLAYDPRLRPNAARLSELCDELADAQPGNNLRQFCRKWKWPPEDAGPGPLTGKHIVEASGGAELQESAENDRASITLMVFDDEPVAPTREQRAASAKPRPATEGPADTKAMPNRADLPTRPLAKELDQKAKWSPPSQAGARPPAKRVGGFEVLLGASTFLILGFLAAIGVGVLVGMFWWSSYRAPLEVTPDASLDIAGPAPSSQAASALADADTEGDGEVDVLPEATDEPQPVKEPPVDESASGTLSVDAKVPVRLHGESGDFEAGDVPLGTYTAQVDFGDGFEAASVEPVLVEKGTQVMVKCSSLRRDCTVSLVDPEPEEGK